MALVDYEVKGHVAIVTLNRPDARNAINPEVAVRLADAWSAAKEDDNVRVIVVTGKGSAFCAGADLGQLIPMISGARKPENEFDHRVIKEPNITSRALLRNFDTEKPVIAAINGHAIAGGMEMVQGTDIRVSCPEAKFGVQEVKWAIFPAGGSTVRLPAQLPFAKAMELLLTGDLISADEAKDIGFLNYVVPADQVMDQGHGDRRKDRGQRPDRRKGNPQIRPRLPRRSGTRRSEDRIGNLRPRVSNRRRKGRPRCIHAEAQAVIQRALTNG